MKIHFRPRLGMLFGFALLGLACATAHAGGAPRALVSCANYNAADAGTRSALAAGYLEGVQAAVDKEAHDMLVPPWHEDHPIWWALPEGEVGVDNLSRRLTAFCAAAANQDTRLPEAFSRIAARTDGEPRIGLPFSDGASDRWRRIIEARGPGCADYEAAREIERTQFVYGYFLGASTINSILRTPPEQSVMVWPDAEHYEVKTRVDAACHEARYLNSTLRDALWVTTAEMGAEGKVADVQFK
jgi:hypothetical protein